MSYLTLLERFNMTTINIFQSCILNHFFRIQFPCLKTANNFQYIWIKWAN